jgi:septum formation protein
MEQSSCVVYAITMKRIILASQSPRRQELLTLMGLDFQAIPSDFDEQLDNACSPEEVAIELGLGKAKAVAQRHPEALIIGSDTIAYIDGEQLGKPIDEADARRMLNMLAGRATKVTTSVALVCIKTGLELAREDTTTVHFKPLDQAALEVYLKTNDWKDKAGAYGIQSGAAPLIASIEGYYDTIVGLPTHLLASMLREQGIESQPVGLDMPVPQSAKTELPRR